MKELRVADNNKRQQEDMPKIAKCEALKMTTKRRPGKEKIEKHKLSRRNMKMKFVKQKNERHLITIINIYGPHSEITEKRPEELENFYDKLEQAVEGIKTRTSIMIIAGDLNSEIGNKTKDNKCIGSFSSNRNNNGINLIYFCEANNLIISNTCFQHSQQQQTTWEQIRIDTNTTKNIRKVLN